MLMHVCTRKQKSAVKNGKWGRPGSIHHLNDIRWTWGRHEGGTDSAGPSWNSSFIHSKSTRFEHSASSPDYDTIDNIQLCLTLFVVAPHVHLIECSQLFSTLPLLCIIVRWTLTNKRMEKPLVSTLGDLFKFLRTASLSTMHNRVLYLRCFSGSPPSFRPRPQVVVYLHAHELHADKSLGITPSLIVEKDPLLDHHIQKINIRLDKYM